MIFLDSHAAIWLYAGEVERFSERARQVLETEPVVISPAVLLELKYLHEVKRITSEPWPMLTELKKSLGLAIHSCDFENLIFAALPQSWTRDPFDRLIVAHADAFAAPLLTKDRNILKNYSRSFWD